MRGAIASRAEAILSCTVLGVAIGCSSSGSGEPMRSEELQRDAEAADASRATDASSSTQDARIVPARDAGADAELPDASVMLPGPWRPLLCNVDGSWQLDTVRFSQPFDSIVLYLPFAALDDDAGVVPAGFIVEILIHGATCWGASDEGLCRERVREQLEETLCPASDLECARFLLLTHGDEVTRVEGREALRELIGSVDTEIDAALATILAGSLVMCWSERTDDDGEVIDTSGTLIRAVEGGYELDTQYDCVFSRLRETARVDPGARVEVTQHGGLCY